MDVVVLLTAGDGAVTMGSNLRLNFPQKGRVGQWKVVLRLTSLWGKKPIWIISITIMILSYFSIFGIYYNIYISHKKY